MSPPLEPPKPLRPIRWWMGGIGLLLIGIAIWGVHSWLSDAARGVDNATHAAQLRVDIIRHSLTVGAGLGGLAALVLTFRRQVFLEHQQRYHERSTEQEFERVKEADAQTAHDATQRRITDLRIQAVEQLGSDKPSVRIGGLHNLERLGEQYPELRQLVLDEICAYLRLQSAQRTVKETDTSGAHEAEVLDTAQSILERHLDRYWASESYWEHVRINLTGAYLKGLNLAGCRLHGANFTRARIFGASAHCKGAEFYNVSFKDAYFEMDADFDYARFRENTNFAGAKFGKAAVFSNATFAPTAEFRGAKFAGDALFGFATFKSGAEFHEVVFAGAAWFESLKGGTDRHFHLHDAVARLDPPELPLQLQHDWPSGWRLATDRAEDGYAPVVRTDPILK